MVNGKIIKVCGMREAENIQEIESLQDIDMLGFIFYPKCCFNAIRFNEPRAD